MLNTKIYVLPNSNVVLLTFLIIMSETHQRIIVGSRVEGKFGPLVRNIKRLDKKRARRVRTVEMGTVIGVSGKRS